MTTSSKTKLFLSDKVSPLVVDTNSEGYMKVNKDGAVTAAVGLPMTLASQANFRMISGRSHGASTLYLNQNGIPGFSMVTATDSQGFYYTITFDPPFANGSYPVNENPYYLGTVPIVMVTANNTTGSTTGTPNPYLLKLPYVHSLSNTGCVIRCIKLVTDLNSSALKVEMPATGSFDFNFVAIGRAN